LLVEKTHDTGDVVLNYLEVGDGPPLVILHGGPADRRDWSEEIGLLAHRWRVLIPDLRGHGRSSWPEDRAYGYDRFVADAKSFIEAIGEPVILIGHSWGGMAAIGVAGSYPELVRAVVLEDPGHLSDAVGVNTDPYSDVRDLLRSGASLEGLIAEYSKGAYNMDAVTARVRAVQSQALDPEYLTTIIEWTQFDEFDPESVASQITAPVLLMHADPDHGMVVLPDSGAERLRASIPDCTYVRMVGAGHQIRRTTPTQFRRVLFDFLDTV